MKKLQDELIWKIKREYPGVIIKISLVLLILSLLWINIVWNTYSADWIDVIVVEKVPWANCVPEWDNYKCTVEAWFDSMIDLMGKIIKYFSYLAGLWTILFIVINGILYSMWWADSSMKEEAKKRIVWTLIWLVLLFLSWIILNLIAPWIYV